MANDELRADYIANRVDVVEGRLAVDHVEQQMPVPNDRPSIQSMVRADLEHREQVGIHRYGTPLQAHNGRNAVRDAYEEALDLAVYLRQVLEEWPLDAASASQIASMEAHFDQRLGDIRHEFGRREAVLVRRAEAAEADARAATQKLDEVISGGQ